MHRLVKSGLTATAIAWAVMFGRSNQALAENVPTPYIQEVLVKSTLVTVSDAVSSDNFAVLHAKISKPFRDQFPQEKLRAVFKDLVDKHAVFDGIVARAIIPDAEAKVDEKGVLRLKGHFETIPKQLKYELGFIPSEGQWKLSAVSIDID